MNKLSLSLAIVALISTPLSMTTPAAAQEEMSAKEFYKKCKGAKSDNTAQLNLCYLDSFVAVRKTGDASGKCAPGLIALLSQPHTHMMKLKETLKESKPTDEEDLKTYQKRILSATYPCAQGASQ